VKDACLRPSASCSNGSSRRETSQTPSQTTPNEARHNSSFPTRSISSPDQLEELWAIDNSAYGAASITYEKFRDWWRAYPPSLLVLHWEKRIGGAIGLWPLSDRTAARLTNARIKEVALTGHMMRPFRKAPARHWYISGMVLRPELSGTHALGFNEM
jgi:hypothetical protein